MQYAFKGMSVLGVCFNFGMLVYTLSEPSSSLYSWYKYQTESLLYTVGALHAALLALGFMKIPLAKQQTIRTVIQTLSIVISTAAGCVHTLIAAFEVTQFCVFAIIEFLSVFYLAASIKMPLGSEDEELSFKLKKIE